MPKDIEIKELKSEVKEIRENHLPHLKLDLAQVKTDVSWLKKFFWIVATSSVGAFITGLSNFFR